MSGRFATKDEVRRTTTACNVNECIRLLNDGRHDSGLYERISSLCPAGGPVVWCDDDGTCRVVSDDSHSITFASTGRGKTRRVVYPSIQTMILAGSSLVVNDMKGEIYQQTQELLESMGYVTYVLDLREPAKSPHRYNPLAIAWDEYAAGNEDRAFLYLRNFGLSVFSQLESNSSDPFWTATATDYFLGLSLGMLEKGVSKEEFTLESVALMDRKGNSRSGMGKTILAEFFASMGDDSLSAQYASGTIDAPNDTRMSILSVFRQPMSLYAGQRGLMDVLSRSDFTPADIALEKRAFFLISPDETHSLGPVVVGIVNQVMSALVSYAQSACNGTLPRRVEFVLDEFGNLPCKVPDMAALVSAARSRNIRLHFVLQSEHQLTHVYGDDLKEVILDNVDTWIYMGSRGLEFMRHISELAGEVHAPSGKTEPLLSVSQLQHLEKRCEDTEALVFTSHLRPFVAALRDIGTYEPIARTSKSLPPKRRVQHRTYDIGSVVEAEKERKMRKLVEEAMPGLAFGDYED